MAYDTARVGPGVEDRDLERAPGRVGDVRGAEVRQPTRVLGGRRVGDHLEHHPTGRDVLQHTVDVAVGARRAGVEAVPVRQPDHGGDAEVVLRALLDLLSGEIAGCGSG